MVLGRKVGGDTGSCFQRFLELPDGCRPVVQ